MNLQNHLLVDSYNRANRRAGTSVSECEINLGTWRAAPRHRESGVQLNIHPGIVSVVLALVALVAVL